MPKKTNWSQVRQATDSGKTRDKVDHADPAAAALGTDEEAGGSRTSQEDITDSVSAREKAGQAKDPASKRSADSEQ